MEAYCNIGVIFKNSGKLEDSILYYDKALSLNPNFTIARSNMAIALTDLGTKYKTSGDIKVLIKRFLFLTLAERDLFLQKGFDVQFWVSGRLLQSWSSIWRSPQD